jgi:hypothetical protein
MRPATPMSAIAPGAGTAKYRLLTVEKLVPAGKLPATEMEMLEMAAPVE